LNPVKALQLSVLLATAYLSLASICGGHHHDPENATCAGGAPRAYAVSGTCGAGGTVELSNDAVCNVTVDGGAVVSLPASGGTVANGQYYLHGDAPLEDGGTTNRHCDSRADGGSDDGGSITFDCDVGDDTACSATLTPVP
jgi:hypothetical protein